MAKDFALIKPRFAATVSPAQLTGNQNDYNPAGLDSASVLRLSSDASRNITGLVTAAVEARRLYIHNVGAQNVVLVNASASSVEAYRFAVGADITIGPDEGVTLLYDATSLRWRCVGKHV